MVILPLTFILVALRITEQTFAVRHVVRPLALVVRAIWVHQAALAFLDTLLEGSLEDFTIRVGHHSHTVNTFHASVALGGQVLCKQVLSAVSTLSTAIELVQVDVVGKRFNLDVECLDTSNLYSGALSHHVADGLVSKFVESI